MALTYTPEVPMGTRRPDFQLNDIFGKDFSSKNLDQKPATVIAFLCGHCPYVQAIESRLIQLAVDLESHNVPFIAICSNDPNENPEDAPEALRNRAEKKGYTFPYLVDGDQSIAKAFGAVCTPDFFVYNSKNQLQYRGRLDDSWKNEKQVQKRELFEAALAIARQQSISFESTPSMGCSIKWKET